MKSKPHYEERIRYEENWHGEGEHYIFEGKWKNEPETDWSLDTAFKLFDYDGRKGELINYQAITKIRELMKLGIPFYFA